MRYTKLYPLFLALCISLITPSAQAGFLDSAKSALGKIDTKKLGEYAKKGQSFLGSLGGGKGGGEGEGGGGGGCPATCPAEQATLAQEIEGTQSLVQKDEQSLLSKGAKFVTSQLGIGSPQKKGTNAGAQNGKKQTLLQKITSNKDTLKGLWSKLQGQTGKLGGKS